MCYNYDEADYSCLLDPRMMKINHIRMPQARDSSLSREPRHFKRNTDISLNTGTQEKYPQDTERKTDREKNKGTEN